MTSISGVMLMSLIGCAPGLRSRRPKAMAALAQAAGRAPGRSQARPRPLGGSDRRERGGLVLHDHLAQVVREAFELGLARGDALAEDVVGEHRRDRDGQAGGRHHQRFADRPRDALDRDRAGRRDAEQRVVDAPDGAEQADERRRAADRGEQHLAELELAEDAVQRVAQAPRQLRVDVAARLERAAGRRRQRRVDERAQHALRGRRRRAGRGRRRARARPRTPAPRAAGRRGRGAAASPSRGSRPRR